MDLTFTTKIPFLFWGSWPGILAIIFGLTLILIFQFTRKFRNFFGLSFLALPGCTLAVFGILGITYTSIEINKSVSKINSHSRQIIKENESDLIQKIKNGLYIEAGNILESVKEKGGFSFIKLYLTPSSELVAQVGKPLSDDVSQNFVLKSKDLDETIVEWGRLDFQIDNLAMYDKVKGIAIQLASFMINMGIGLFISSLLLAFYFFRHLKRPSLFVSNLRKAVTNSKDVEDLLSRINLIDYNEAFLEEELHLKHNLNAITVGMTELQNRWLKNETDAILGRMASQVSHDIRSPLSALNMVLTTLGGLPEDKRMIIRNSTQRINDIANLLLQKGKDKNQEKNHNQDCEPVMLVSILDSIVSEKRAQYRQRLDVDIQTDISSGYGLFAKIQSTDLARAISNAVNNSVEAFTGKGYVTISLSSDNDFAIISIKDNGKGIPKHILEKLGERGVTFGKDGTQSGSGLGVFQAKTSIEAIGGKYEIISKENSGTIITMKLPKASAPWWFMPLLSFKKGTKIVSLDDDSTIHQVWAERFRDEVLLPMQHKHVSFSSIEIFEKWLQNQKIDNIYFLIDFEFLNQTGNGLDVIERNKIAEKSVLVTSRFDETVVRDRAKQLGIKILPKGLAPFVPIVEQQENLSLDNILVNKEVSLNINFLNIKNSQTSVNSDTISKYDLCLIDDDKLLVHSIWGMVAKEKGLNIKMFERPEEFLSQASQIDKSTPIYVDVSLGNNISGIEVANQIYELGFKNINLATGYDSESIKVPSFIHQVVGKDFPI